MKVESNSEKNKWLEFSKKSISTILVLILLAENVSASAPVANNIVIDNTNGSSTGGSLSHSMNGTDVVNITAPNASGISHNQFVEFNVSNQGVILNNSKVDGTATAIGGLINANPNLNGSSASIILNEVTSSKTSQLLGPIEVGGSAANVIVANPNGITCNGCGFINTPRATLVTGVPNIRNTDGRINGITLSDNKILIGTDGVSGNDYLDIVARAVKIEGEIRANAKINLILGKGVYDYTTQNIANEADITPGPVVAIDAGELGSMYSGMIKIVVNEKGVGANLPNLIASSDVEIDGNGDIKLKKVIATNNIKIKGNKVKTADIIKGNIVDIEGTEKAVVGSKIFSNNATTIAGKSIELSEGSLYTGLNPTTLETTKSRLTLKGDDIKWSDSATIYTFGGLTVEGYSGEKANLLHMNDGNYWSTGDENFLRVKALNFGDQDVTSTLVIEERSYSLNLDPNAKTSLRSYQNQPAADYYVDVLNFLGEIRDNLVAPTKAYLKDSKFKGSNGYLLNKDQIESYMDLSVYKINPKYTHLKLTKETWKLNYEPAPLIFQSDYKTNFDVDNRTFYNGDFLSPSHSINPSNDVYVENKTGSSITSSAALLESFKTKPANLFKKLAGSKNHREISHPVEYKDFDNHSDLTLIKAKVYGNNTGTIENLNLAYSEDKKEFYQIKDFQNVKSNLDEILQQYNEKPIFSVETNPKYYDQRAYVNSELYCRQCRNLITSGVLAMSKKCMIP